MVDKKIVLPMVAVAMVIFMAAIFMNQTISL